MFWFSSKTDPPEEALFDRAFTLLIGEEGGYVDDPRDPGGETKFGISRRAYPDLDIAALTLDQARAIYRRDYWQPLGCEDLSWPTALVLFDAGVNMGLRRATMLLQEALGEVADGIIGPRTRAALAAQDGDPELVIRFQAERALFYASLGTFRHFGRGWLRRTLRTTAAAFNAGVKP